MTDVKQTIKTTTFQIANRMGIDSKHPKVRNFSVKFKAFSKDENHKLYMVSMPLSVLDAS